LTTELVTDEPGLRNLRPAWDRLHGAASATNPFGDWTWAWHWWQSFGRRHGQPRDELYILVMRDDTQTVRAIVPLIRTSVGWGRLGIHLLRLYGFGSITELRTPLVWPGWEAAAGEALMQALSARREAYHFCVLDGVIADTSLGEWLAARAREAGWTLGPRVVGYILPLPESWDALRAGLKRNIKESLRHCYNSLAREGHDLRFELVSDPAALPGALDDFFHLHAVRAGQAGGVAHPNHFASPASKEFLRRVVGEFAATGKAVVGRLYLNERLVATRLVFVAGKTVYLYFSGYDPAWGRYSVATTVLAECLKAAIAAGAGEANLSVGTDVSKTRWGPREMYIESVRVVAPTLEGRVMTRLYDIAQRVRRERVAPARYRMAKAVRDFSAWLQGVVHLIGRRVST
jgi:CelD/BcsL family acetyltransferase involved in cellulose biosynthesis